MADDREELISPPPEPDAGKVLPRSPTRLSAMNDEKPLIPISEAAVVDGGGVHLQASNYGGRDSTEITLRSKPIALVKHSLVIAAQTAAAIILLPVHGFSSAAKFLPNLAAVLTIFSYFCCIYAAWVSKSNPLIAGLMAEMSTACAGVSFLVVVGLILPQKLFWIVVLNCLVLVSVFAGSFFN